MPKTKKESPKNYDRWNGKVGIKVIKKGGGKNGKK